MAWFFLTIAAVFFIVIETIIEKKTLVEARSTDFAAMFAFGNVIVLTPLLFVADISQISFFILGMIFLASIPSAVASLLVFKTIKHNQLSESAPILALLPLVVTLLAYLMLDEKIAMMQLFGIFLIIGGMIYLELNNFKFSSGIFRKGRGKYILYILLYLLVGGISAMFDRVILFKYKINPLSYLIFIQIFIATNYLVFFLYKSRLIGELKSSIGKSWKIIFLVSILTVSHRYMYASAIQVAASMGLVVAVYKISSLFHVFAGGKFFAEEGIVKKALASVLVVSGTILLILK